MDECIYKCLGPVRQPFKPVNFWHVCRNSHREFASIYMRLLTIISVVVNAWLILSTCCHSPAPKQSYNSNADRRYHWMKTAKKHHGAWSMMMDPAMNGASAVVVRRNPLFVIGYLHRSLCAHFAAIWGTQSALYAAACTADHILVTSWSVHTLPFLTPCIFGPNSPTIFIEKTEKIKEKNRTLTDALFLWIIS